MKNYYSKIRWCWCPVWLGLAALTIMGTGCDTIVDGLLQGQCDDDARKAYKQYYVHGGCDRQTAAKQADFDVLWDHMSDQH